MKADELVQIDQACFPDSCWNIDSWKSLIQQPHNQLFTEVLSDTLQGFLLMSHVAGEAELLKIGVLPALRKKGIARNLMDRAINWCRKNQVESFFLEVHEQNEPAIQLYMDYSFQQIARRKNYYHNPPGDALIFQLKMI